MGHKNREIEYKLLVHGATTLASVNKLVREFVDDLYCCRQPIVGCATDIYWAAPEESDADFARLRKMDSDDGESKRYQITLKCTDRDDNTNRVEIDLEVEDGYQANKLLSFMIGDPLGQVTKKYHVYFLDDNHTTISVYKVLKDPRVFIEVEAKTLKQVERLTKELNLTTGLEFSICRKSLFELFVKKEEMKLDKIDFY